jgi:anionic cell wall polymer biosynthesis LytR-Cps2A-Psr (LCP) family protein
MGKIVKIIGYLIIFLVIILGIVSYFDYGGITGVKKALSGKCKSFHMTVDKQSKAYIGEIVTTLSNTSTMGLAFKSSHLKAIGKKVDDKVPSPLMFLAVIFTDKKLADDMKIVKESSFKYNNFCQGLYKNMMTSYHNKECFKKNIYSFSKQLKINPEKTYTVAETCGKHGENGSKDAFRPFVDYLIKELAH